MPTLKSPSMRTVDVARHSGYSVQQIRNLERDGVLPPADRTASGYRVYAEVHLNSALAYRALAAGTGPVEAKDIVRAAHEGPVARLLARLDAVHARLDRERTELGLAKEAAAAISAEPIADVSPADAMGVGELAAALGVRASTLRHWDAEGLVVPDRIDGRGTRRYSPAQVRDARIVHQLRSAGHRIEALRRLMPDLRSGRQGADTLEASLAAREAGIAARSRALLDASAAVLALLAPAAPAGADG
ncbi:MerR family transcriptional regulator [Streptomyces sp. NPDC049949]|uniref:MerR family transcriptional regulator n=1 Tax=Streptomyces sp. NPDC049949 TaxID=3154627 RepID=UPI00343FDB66